MAVWKKIGPDDTLVDRNVAGVERWNESDGVKPAAVPPAAKDYGDGDDFLGGDDHE